MRLVLGKTPEQLVRMLDMALRKQAERWKPAVYRCSYDQECVEITPEHRNEIVRWLAQLNKKFYFAPETFALATTVLDRFLTTVKCRPRHLRLIGLASFYLAAKTLEEDEVLPETLELVQTSECGCSVAEVLRMERVVLDKLGWDLNASTALEFLHVLYALLLSRQPRLLDHVPQMTASRQLSMLTDKLQHCLADHRLAMYHPAALAVATLSLELEQFAADWLPASVWLQTLAQCDHKEFLSCREIVARALLTIPNKSFAYAYQCRQSQRATKRKMAALEDSDDEDEDIYEGIKRLYNEDTDVPVTALVSCVN